MADTLDVLSLAEAKGAINMLASNNDHNSEIERQVTAVSRVIDDAVGPVVHRTVTAELHDTGREVRLRQAPVVSVSSVRVASGGAITTLSSVAFGAATDGYRADLDRGRLYRQWGGVDGDWDTASRIEVTYVAGRYATTAAVDALFKEAASAVLRRLWKREAGTWMQAAEFFNADDSPTAGFFRVARPTIDELLAGERPVLVG